MTAHRISTIFQHALDHAALPKKLKVLLKRDRTQLVKDAGNYLLDHIKCLPDYRYSFEDGCYLMWIVIGAGELYDLYERQVTRKYVRDNLGKWGVVYAPSVFTRMRELKPEAPFSKEYEQQKSTYLGTLVYFEVVTEDSATVQECYLGLPHLIEYPSHLCAYQSCSKPEPQKLCSKCQRAFYCNRECQSADWTHHRHNCKKMEI